MIQLALLTLAFVALLAGVVMLAGLAWALVAAGIGVGVFVLLWDWPVKA